MRNLSEHDGVFITDDLLSRLNHAVQLEGRQSKLARIMNVPENNLSNWLGKTKKTSSMISWEQWAKVRAYLVKAELIDAEDHAGCFRRRCANGSWPSETTATSRPDSQPSTQEPSTDP